MPLVAQLLEAGHEVTGLARKVTRLERMLVDSLAVDLLDRGAVLEAVKGRAFDAIIHQATDLRRAPTMYSSMHVTNRLRTEGTSTLIAVARATGAKRFVTASTFYGYGFIDHGTEPLTEAELFGHQNAEALDPVRLALLSNEQQVRAFGGVSLRYGLVYGRRGPVVAADWDGVLPMLHREDAASAAVSALAHGKPGAAYNIADERPASWRELQQTIAIAEGTRPPLAVPSSVLRASAPFAADLLTRTSMRLSTALARRELRWSPRYASFADGLRPSVVVGAAA
jgi:nucleoside-diphosphate-sugar epimerase